MTEVGLNSDDPGAEIEISSSFIPFRRAGFLVAVEINAKLSLINKHCSLPPPLPYDPGGTPVKREARMRRNEREQ